MKGYLELLKLQGWKWQESEQMFFESLSVCSLTYLP
jgi:hypothetical protein